MSKPRGHCAACGQFIDRDKPRASAPSPWLRLCFAYVDHDELIEGAARLGLKLGAEAGVLDLQDRASVLKASVFGVFCSLVSFSGPCAGSGKEIWIRCN